ncbi:MAG: L-aspartate oxidase [Desulfobulbaceae bacterium]|nr:MAG: L-aspartate oxidase [Desulfobulbaceae bacterium]
MDSDFLVVGSGIAGLSFALKVAEFGSVIIITKKRDVDTATNLAQGGIAAVVGRDDSFKEHINDTLRAGDGLCDSQVVKLVIESGKERIDDLISYGVGFVKGSDGLLSLGKEGGHSKRRVAHAYDLTGREIERALLLQVRKNKNINLLEQTIAVDLLINRTGEGSTCFGAYVMGENNEVVPVTSSMTILCTGGAGKVYLYTSNPDIATGDGVAMAARAGAKIGNMEFVQFHPTCLFHPQAKNFLISEAVRGEGGILVDHNGNRFMEKYDERLELATRDIIARSIDTEMKTSGADCVFLDVSHLNKDFLSTRFPGIYNKCKEFGLDISQEPIPVVPAAHYMCGGIAVDHYGNSTVPGLMALGESSCSGLHGANRLASNSLLEAVVYADRAAMYCVENLTSSSDSQDRPEWEADEWSAGEANFLNEEILINHDWDVIRRTMWNYVGIVRTTQRLELARRRLITVAEEIEDHYRKYIVSRNMIELRNILHVALLVTETALHRKESRGLHYSIDFPKKSDDCLFWTMLTRADLNGDPWDFRLEEERFDH